MSQLIPLFQALDTVGDGSGTTNATGNYAAVATGFKMVCPSGKGHTITQLMIHIAGPTNFALTGYGSIAGGVTNGVVIQFSLGGVLMSLNAGMPFKSNDDWAHASADVNHLTFVGGGDSLVIPFKIADFGIPLVLAAGDFIQVLLNDDFTGLTSQHFIAHGYEN